jgi:hypothetical protein
LSFRLAIVGDCRPIPGLTKSAWFSGDVKAAGVERLCETRYVFSSDNGVVLQAIWTSVSPTRMNIHRGMFSKLTPGACAALSASTLAAASSFNALPFSLAEAAATAAAFCLLFLACAAAAICRSRTVDASERESSVVTVFFAGGIVARFLSLVDNCVALVLASTVAVQVEWPDSNARSMSVLSSRWYESARAVSILSVEAAVAGREQQFAQLQYDVVLRVISGFWDVRGGRCGRARSCARGGK